MASIETLNADQPGACIDQLVELLQDAVDGRRFRRFLPPLLLADARSYWRKVQARTRDAETLRKNFTLVSMRRDRGDPALHEGGFGRSTRHCRHVP